MCTRAAEADGLVSIYKNGQLINDQEVSTASSSRVILEKAIFKNGTIKNFGFALSRYIELLNEIRQLDCR